jgi:hypothetical protein
MENNNDKFKNNLIKNIYKLENVYTNKILNDNLKEIYYEMLKNNNEKNIFDIQIIKLDEQLDKPIKNYIPIKENNDFIL